jgi:hypothetical protein
MSEPAQAPESGPAEPPPTPPAQGSPDLSFLLPMIDRVRAVEIRFQDEGPGSTVSSADLPTLDALQTRVRRLEEEVQGLRRGLEAISPALGVGSGAGGATSLLGHGPTELAPQPIERLLFSALVATVLLVLAHWLVVVVFDLHTVVLRLVSIAIPFVVAVAMTLGRQLRLSAEALAAVAVAFLSVAGMSYVTSALEGTSPLPQDAREWRETVEYVASIAFAYLTGVLASSAWQAHQGVRHEVGENTLRLAQAIARLTGKAVATGPELRNRIASVQELINTLALVGAGATSLVTALKGVTG